MDGILNVNKPPGITSFRVVARVRRLTGERRVGHAGTLDPLAAGVLPVGVGQGTRVLEFLSEASKVYRAEVELGVATDTYDREGKIVQQKDPSHITREQVESALASFRGTINQTPPPYSALKQNGKPLYKLARAGIAVTPKSRRVHIYRLELTGWQPPAFTIEVECSKGTYIRSLAHDLGQALGRGAVLQGLVRLRYGPFELKDAVTLPQLEEASCQGQWERLLHPLDSVLGHWQKIVVDEATANDLRQGKLVFLEGVSPPSEAAPCCRAYTSEGSFIGVISFDAQESKWRAKKIFHTHSPDIATPEDSSK